VTEQNRATLKTYFETGRVPTQDQFAQLIDSSINKSDDGITVAADRKLIGMGDLEVAATLSVKGQLTTPLTGKVRVAQHAMTVTGGTGAEATRFQTELRVNDFMHITPSGRTWGMSACLHGPARWAVEV